MEIKSIINDILEDINKEQDMNKIKDIFTKRVSESKINKADRVRMLKGIKIRKTYFSTMKYIYDCLLKYEGDGVISESTRRRHLKI